MGARTHLFPYSASYFDPTDKEKASLTKPCIAISQHDLELIAEVFQVPATMEACFQAAYEACKRQEWQILKPYEEILYRLVSVQGHPLLISMIDAGDFELASELLRQEITIHAVDNQGNSILHHASKKSDSRFFQLVYEKQPFPNIKNIRGLTPLHYAALHGHSLAITTFLANGADLNATASITIDDHLLTNVTPVHLAVVNGNLNVIDPFFCIDATPDLTLLIPEIGNILHLAIYYHHMLVVPHLLTKYGSLMRPLLRVFNLEKRTPCMLAASVGNIEALQFLTAKGVPLNEPNSQGQTALHFAVLNLQYQSAEFLCNHGANLDASDEEMMRPIDLVRSKSSYQNLQLYNLLSSHSMKGEKGKIAQKPHGYMTAETVNIQEQASLSTFELKKLTQALKAITTKLPSEEKYRVIISGGGLTETRYLRGNLFTKLIDPATGNLIRQYSDSLHSVCSLEHDGFCLHFKQSPSQPMVEYAVYSLTKRIIGEGAPPSTLLRFDVETPSRKVSYPVLLTKTIQGTNLKTLLYQNPNYKPDPIQFTLLALCQLLIRPGDGRSANYIVTAEDKLVSIDNEFSFVEPVVQDRCVQMIRFCSILFCLNGPQLDPTALEYFIHTDPDLIFKDWLDELISKETEYQNLFTTAEQKSLYQKKNSFTPHLIFETGTMAKLYTQYLHLQDYLKEAIVASKEFNKETKQVKYPLPVHATDLLAHFITLTPQGQIKEDLGSLIQKKYRTSKSNSPEEALKEALGKVKQAFITTQQPLNLGKVTFIEKELYSLEKAKQEFLLLFHKKQEPIEITENQGNISISIDFRHYTLGRGKPDIEKQKLVLDGVRAYLREIKKRPIALSFIHCDALTHQKLCPFLHPKLVYLDIRGSKITSFSKELKLAAPNLKELFF